MRRNCEETAKKREETSWIRDFGHLETLLKVIQHGARLGLAVKLDGVTIARVAQLLTLAGDSHLDADAYEAQCRRAGPVTTLAAVIESYRGVMGHLEAEGEDVFAWHAALELALAHRPGGEG